MTPQEAEAVAAIIQHADGGCCNCVEALARRAARAFPQFVWEARDRRDGEVRMDKQFDSPMRVDVVLAGRKHP